MITSYCTPATHLPGTGYAWKYAMALLELLPVYLLELFAVAERQRTRAD